MRIKHLSIKGFKNLRDFLIKFDAESPTTVLVGRNGTGKSNLLEALTIIFRDLDLGEGPTITYSMVYECRGHQVRIITFPDEPRKKAVITVDGQGLTYKQLSRKKDYLPKFVFGYYSGPGNRMEKHFEKHQKRFSDDLLRGNDRPLRPLFYARPVHSQFVLLAFFLKDEPGICDLLDELRILSLDSVLFVMKKPHWFWNRKPRDFWGAKGVVRALLDTLYDISLAPIVLNEKIYLYLKDKSKLRKLATRYETQREFFKALESTYISDLIYEVRIRVKARNVDGSLTFRELSEGEQQLLMVLGLLRFTKEDESLFLLDEPDTHLNPAWSLRYLNFLKKFASTEKNSHVIMATHDPLVIAGLTRNQVQIMQREEETGNIFTEHPSHDPKGMGIAGLLTSDIYQLRSSLDLPTQKLLDKHRRLASKQGKLSRKEKVQFKNYNEKLCRLGIIRTIRDPLYERFIEEWSKYEDEIWLKGPDLTTDQRKKQKQLARNIVKRLAKEKGVDS